MKTKPMEFREDRTSQLPKLKSANESFYFIYDGRVILYFDLSLASADNRQYSLSSHYTLSHARSNALIDLYFTVFRY